MFILFGQMLNNPGTAAALFGTVGFGCVVTWPLLTTRREAIIVQSAGAIAFTLHFALIGAPTASAACILSLMQLVVEIVVRGRVARLALGGASLLALLLFTAATWHGVSSGLIACGGAISFFARAQRSTTRMKAGFLIAAPFWLAHNLLIGAPFALAVDLASVTSNLSGLFFHARRKRFGCAIGATEPSYPNRLVLGVCSGVRELMPYYPLRSMSAHKCLRVAVRNNNRSELQ